MAASLPGDPVIVIGAGVQAAITARAALEAGYRIDGFFADDPPMIGKNLIGYRVKGPINDIGSAATRRAIIGIGSNEARKRLAESLDLEWVTVVHPSAVVDPEATLGAGTVVLACAVVEIGVEIGSHVIINTLSSAHHNCFVGDYVQVAEATVSAYSIVEEGVLVGTRSTVLHRVRVGAWSTVAAAALVTRDVAPNDTVMGIPARSVLRE